MDGWLDCLITFRQFYKLTFFCNVGGETIKQINQQTGAHCELDRRPPPNLAEKTFVIRGSPDQIEQAKRLIAEKLGMVSITVCPSYISIYMRSFTY